jgi:hypothetical protein
LFLLLKLAFDFPQKKTLFPIFTTQFIFNSTPCLTVMAPQARPQLYDASKTLNDFFQHYIPSQK